jgi:hypothetical protein
MLNRRQGVGIAIAVCVLSVIVFYPFVNASNYYGNYCLSSTPTLGRAVFSWFPRLLFVAKTCFSSYSLNRKDRRQNAEVNGVKLSVFKGREAGLNRAIFAILARESPKNIKELQKQVSKQKGLEGTYYASLTKRLHCLLETGYIAQAKPTEAGIKTQAYELRVKAYLASFLDAYSMQDIIDQATDTQAALILLALLNVIAPEKD